MFCRWKLTREIRRMKKAVRFFPFEMDFNEYVYIAITQVRKKRTRNKNSIGKNVQPRKRNESISVLVQSLFLQQLFFWIFICVLPLLVGTSDVVLCNETWFAVCTGLHIFRTLFKLTCDLVIFHIEKNLASYFINGPIALISKRKKLNLTIYFILLQHTRTIVGTHK